MRLKKYEIRISVTKNLYDRIALEATNRDTKIAAVAREKLAECFISKIVNPLLISNNPQENQTNHIIYAELIKTEKQLSSAASRIESLLALSQDQMKFIVTMVDQFYFDLMKYLPDIPKQLALVADTTAKLRHRQWLETIKNIIDFEK